MPVFEQYGKLSALDELHFFLLVLSTIMIAAAGYIINDYFDIKMDVINKPNRIIVGKEISRRMAMATHLILNAAGIAIGIYLGWKVGNIKLGGFHFVSAGLLWFYSTTYKKQFLIGNIIVAFLTAIVVLIIPLYEPILFTATTPSDYYAVGGMLSILLPYAFFAFMISLIREIVKDMQDIKGDASYDCKTLPLVLGISKSKIVVYALILIFILSGGYIQSKLFTNPDFRILFYIILVAIQTPLIYMLWLLNKADTKDDFRSISTVIKIIMLFGILSMGYFIYHLTLSIEH